jgi:hypothetical protein
MTPLLLSAASLLFLAELCFPQSRQEERRRLLRGAVLRYAEDQLNSENSPRRASVRSSCRVGARRNAVTQSRVVFQTATASRRTLI